MADEQITAWYRLYTEYMRSVEWQAQRQAAITRSGGRCQLCNSDSSLQVHHRTYERLGNEAPDDLTVLCGGCHEWFSRRFKPARTAAAKSAGGVEFVERSKAARTAWQARAMKHRSATAKKRRFRHG